MMNQEKIVGQTEVGKVRIVEKPKITIDIDGKNFEGFTEATVTRSIENFSGTFSFSAFGSPNIPFPIKISQLCVIKIESIPVITGYVEKIDVNYDATPSHTIKISGRDKTADIIDSTLGTFHDLTPPFTVEQLIKKVLDYLNIKDIKVISETQVEAIEKVIDTVSYGTGAFDHIESFIKTKQVLLTTDGYGNIVLTRASDKEMKTKLSLEKNIVANILSAGISYDYTKRFYSYEASDSSSPVTPFFAKAITDPKQTTNVNGLQYDTEIRHSRRYAFQPDSETENTDMKNRIIWELNFRKTQSKVYNVVVPEFKPQNDEGIWIPNRIVQINDDFAQLNTRWLISSVEYTYSLTDGSKTALKLVSRDGFTIKAEKPKKGKKEKTGGNFFPTTGIYE